jgi:hypothetical protein
LKIVLQEEINDRYGYREGQKFILGGAFLRFPNGATTPCTREGFPITMEVDFTEVPLYMKKQARARFTKHIHCSAPFLPTLRSAENYFTRMNFKDLISLLLVPPFPRFKRLGILIEEIGSKNGDFKEPCSLRIVIGASNEHVIRHPTFIPACKACDAMVFSNEVAKHVSIPGRSPIPCPHCGAPLDIYLRKGAIHFLEFDYDNADWQKSMNYDGNIMHVPIKYHGILHQLEFTEQDEEYFCEHLGLVLPGGIVGPFDLICHLLPDHTAGTAIVVIDTIKPSSRTTSRMLPETRLFPPKLVLPSGRIYNKKMQVNEHVHRAGSEATPLQEKAAKKALAWQLMIKNAQDADILIKNRIPFDFTRFVKNVYVKLSHYDYNNSLYRFHFTMHDVTGRPIAFIINTATTASTHLPPAGLEKFVVREKFIPEIARIVIKDPFHSVAPFQLVVNEASIPYPNGAGFSQVLQPIIAAPGKQSKQILMRGTRGNVKACYECKSLLLRCRLDNGSERDDFAGNACPYCGKRLRIVNRAPMQYRLDVTIEGEDKHSATLMNAALSPMNALPGKPVQGSQALGSWHHQYFQRGSNRQLLINAQYNGKWLPYALSVTQIRDIVLKYQAGFPNGMLGPFQLKLAMSFSLPTLEAILPDYQGNSIEWRPSFELPEDRIAH